MTLIQSWNVARDLMSATLPESVLSSSPLPPRGSMRDSVFNQARPTVGYVAEYLRWLDTLDTVTLS